MPKSIETIEQIELPVQEEESAEGSTSISNEVTAPAPDPFDLSKLRLDQSFIETTGVKKLLTTVPVGRPNKQDFVRIHPGLDYRETFAMIELQEDREYYILLPHIARELPPDEYFPATVFTCINRQGVVRLVPVRLPVADRRSDNWHKSLMEGVLIAMHRWCRIKANMSLGAYETFPAPTTIPDPTWPGETFRNLLRIGFRDRLVDSFDHPLIKRLLGLS